jgi:hypothetical protein
MAEPISVAQPGQPVLSPAFLQTVGGRHDRHAGEKHGPVGRVDAMAKPIEDAGVEPAQGDQEGELGRGCAAAISPVRSATRNSEAAENDGAEARWHVEHVEADLQEGVDEAQGGEGEHGLRVLAETAGPDAAPSVPKTLSAASRQLSPRGKTSWMKTNQPLVSMIAVAKRQRQDRAWETSSRAAPRPARSAAHSRRRA